MSAFKDNLLVGKAAFVAGGTSGINLGIARRLADLGAKVAVAGRNPERAAAAAEAIGHGALGFSADVRDYAAIRGALQATAERFGPLDIVVSGAAGNFLAPAAEMSANAFRTVVDIDLNGTFNVFRAAHDLLAKPGASLIAITAPQAVNATAFQAHACAAKAGINHLVRVAALEWGLEGVRVNGISPGPIANTEGVARLSKVVGGESPGARVPLGRWGEVAEIAECAVFLCSEAASYITGTILTCDGGTELGDASRLRAPSDAMRA